VAATLVKGPESGHGRNHRGARIFDRHSGSNRTGVKAVDKRNGAGAHNWGSPEQEIQMYQKDDSRRNKLFSVFMCRRLLFGSPPCKQNNNFAGLFLKALI